MKAEVCKTSHTGSTPVCSSMEEFVITKEWVEKNFPPTNDELRKALDKLDEKFNQLNKKFDALVSLFEEGFELIDKEISNIKDEVMCLTYNAN
jgi:hypothetical protein